MNSLVIVQNSTIAFLLLACSFVAFAQSNEKPAWSDLPNFSATETKGSLSWKIYHSADRLRVQPSSTGATIWAPAEDKVYNLLLLPEKSTCVVMKTKQAGMMRSPLQIAYGPNSHITPTDKKEVLDGHSCTIQEGAATLANGNRVSFKVWTADDLKGVPLRIELYGDRRTVSSTYHDVVLGTPEAALFTLPSKCVANEKTYQVAPGSAPLPKQEN